MFKTKLSNRTTGELIINKNGTRINNSLLAITRNIHGEFVQV